MPKTDVARKSIEEELQKPSPDWGVVEVLSRGLVDNEPGRVRFSVDAGHINRLGMELVGRQETALSELIKNAFDADATLVTLDFTDQSRVGGTLVIADDGNGMTEEIIRSNWMRISTIDKANNPRSPRYNRMRAGKKGIGRFAVQRLGEILELETRPRGSQVGFRVRFAWDEQFKAGRDLQDIFSVIEKFEKSPEEQGTKLSIISLKDAWSEVAIERVWRSVILLQPPFAPERVEQEMGSPQIDPGFQVEINGTTKQKQQTLFSIEKDYLDQAIARIDAEIDEHGRASVRVRSRKLNLDESQAYDEVFDLTGPVSLSARYFIYASSSLSGMKMSAAAEIGRKFGGVRIYRNGFRVMPYGEPADDWLRLDIDISRRLILIPANNRNFFGQVVIGSELNPLFEETSSREGLLENEAFEQLRAFSRHAIEWSAKRVGSVRNRKQTAGQKDFTPVPKPPKPSDLLRKIREDVAKVNQSPTSLLGQTHAKLAEVEQAVTELEERADADRIASLEYSEMLRLLASLGLSISVFSHEVKGARGSMIARISHLQNIVSHLLDEKYKEEVEAELVQLSASANRIFDIGGYIAGLMTSTEARELKTHSVLGSIERFVKQFTQYMSRQGVAFEYDVEPVELRTTKMHAAELDSVLLNFLTNSIKSMKKAKQEFKKVRIQGRSEGELLVISFEDNGVGIAGDAKEKVFEAFYTTTMGADEDDVAGPGSGLGLKIVSDIATSYGGDARVGIPSEGFTCRMEFRVLSSDGIQGSLFE